MIYGNLAYNPKTYGFDLIPSKKRETSFWLLSSAFPESLNSKTSESSLRKDKGKSEDWDKEGVERVFVMR
jgi:hypothetical protein